MSVSVDPGGDESESVEYGRNVSSAGRQGKRGRRVAQRNDDRAGAVVGGGVVFESPVEAGAVGVDSGRGPRRRGAFGGAVDTVERIDAEPFGGRSLNRESQEVHGDGGLLRRVDGDTVYSVKEAEEGRAVGDAPA